MQLVYVLATKKSGQKRSLRIHGAASSKRNAETWKQHMEEKGWPSDRIFLKPCEVDNPDIPARDQECEDPPPEVIEPPLDMGRVRFSKHALSQLIDRYKCFLRTSINEDKAELLARKLLMRARPEIPATNRQKIKRVRRLINNEFVEAMYYVVRKWRFVVVEESDALVVATVEWII